MGLFFAMTGGLWVYSLPREGACGSILCHEREVVGLFLP